MYDIQLKQTLLLSKLETEEERKSKVESAKTMPSSICKTTKEPKKVTSIGKKQAIKIAMKKSIKKHPKYQHGMSTRR